MYVLFVSRYISMWTALVAPWIADRRTCATPVPSGSTVTTIPLDAGGGTFIGGRAASCPPESVPLVVLLSWDETGFDEPLSVGCDPESDLG
jgi:hypothetical protein